MELVLILPIFLLLICGIVELSMLMSADARVHDAARQASRTMSISDQNPDQIRLLVTRVLGPRLSRNCQIELFPGKRAGDVGNVVVRVPMRNASPDLLWMTGFSVRNRTMTADAPMVTEHHVAWDTLERL